IVEGDLEALVALLNQLALRLVREDVHDAGLTVHRDELLRLAVQVVRYLVDHGGEDALLVDRVVWIQTRERRGLEVHQKQDTQNSAHGGVVRNGHLEDHDLPPINGLVESLECRWHVWAEPRSELV